MKHILLIIAALYLFGCNVQKKVLGLGAKHPVSVAKACYILFPIHDSVIVHTDTVTTITKGDVQYVSVNCDSAIKYRHDTAQKIVRIACPSGTLITKLVTKDSIVYRESTARITTLNGDVTKLSNNVARIKRGRNNWRMASIIEGLLLVLIAVFLYLKGKAKIISKL